MPVTVRSFAKINLGLCIGPLRADGFHELATIYQTVAWHDQVSVEVAEGSGIEVHCAAEGVPNDEKNTCYHMAGLVLEAAGVTRRVRVRIEKTLPVQGGLGGASSNAVATLLGLEKELGVELGREQELALAAQVGSDLPLFLIGGTVLGWGRGEQVQPAPDLPALPCVLATPPIGISTPRAFADWDGHEGGRDGEKLTHSQASARMNAFNSAAFLWLNGFMPRAQAPGRLTSGVPVQDDRGRAETLLLDLVRAGIANDFEEVVFPQHPELAEIKRGLEKAGARYASLSGSGSTVYGLFCSAGEADAAASTLLAAGVPARATRTLTRKEYWDGVVLG